MNKFYDNSYGYSSLVLALAGSVSFNRRRFGIKRSDLEILNNSLIDFVAIIMLDIYRESV